MSVRNYAFLHCSVKENTFVLLEMPLGYLTLVCKQMGMKVPSIPCEASCPSSLFLGEQDRQEDSNNPRVGSR